MTVTLQKLVSDSTTSNSPSDLFYANEKQIAFLFNYQ